MLITSTYHIILKFVLLLDESALSPGIIAAIVVAIVVVIVIIAVVVFKKYKGKSWYSYFIFLKFIKHFLNHLILMTLVKG